MVKNILLRVDDEKFYELKVLKSIWQANNKKDMTWENFLVDWVIELNKLIFKKGEELALQEAYKKMKPEEREAFESYCREIFRSFVADYKRLKDIVKKERKEE